MFFTILSLSFTSLFFAAHTLVRQRTSVTAIMVNTMIFIGLLATLLQVSKDPVTPFIQINIAGLVLSFLQIIGMYSLRHHAEETTTIATLESVNPIKSKVYTTAKPTIEPIPETRPVLAKKLQVEAEAV